ncbi:MAG TPA: dUTP diphosphatase [Clostridiales bacterium]|nr:dUTP diphosphatase [Clostridiales bacterium]
MKVVAQFEKVSFEQFEKDYKGLLDVKTVYDEIVLPKRATKGSAGYDFFANEDIKLSSGETCLVPTGVRVKIEDGWFLSIFPRSGLGFKYRLQLDNTVGIIDSDYYESSNEGHIFIKITCDAKTQKTIEIKKGEGIAQGIFLPFGLAAETEVTAKRDGGFGSTTKKQL